MSSPQTDSSKQKTGSLFRTVGVGHLGVCVCLCGELLVALGRGLDGAVTGVPVGRADFAVLVGELEGVDQTESFVDGAADGEVVDGDLPRVSANGSCLVICPKSARPHSACRIVPQ
jgi:hypothetical protein